MYKVDKVCGERMINMISSIKFGTFIIRIKKPSYCFEIRIKGTLNISKLNTQLLKFGPEKFEMDESELTFPQSVSIFLFFKHAHTIVLYNLIARNRTKLQNIAFSIEITLKPAEMYSLYCFL